MGRPKGVTRKSASGATATKSAATRTYTHPEAQSLLRPDVGTQAYEYPDKWTNRMILGDSLVVMNSFLHYEGLGGQVQLLVVKKLSEAE